MTPSDKPARCPNRECRSENVGAFYRHLECKCRCLDCGVTGPAVQHVEPIVPPDATGEEAMAILNAAILISINHAVYLWNHCFPREAEKAGVARGEL